MCVCVFETSFNKFIFIKQVCIKYNEKYPYTIGLLAGRKNLHYDLLLTPEMIYKIQQSPRLQVNWTDWRIVLLEDLKSLANETTNQVNGDHLFSMKCARKWGVENLNIIGDTNNKK